MRSRVFQKPGLLKPVSDNGDAGPADAQHFTQKFLRERKRVALKLALPYSRQRFPYRRAGGELRQQDRLQTLGLSPSARGGRREFRETH
jgi:hypothetical protein